MTLFAFFFATKLSLDGLVASPSRTRALVPDPSSSAHARLSSFHTDNVLEAAVRLSAMQIIAVLLNYRDTAQLYTELV